MKQRLFQATCFATIALCAGYLLPAAERVSLLNGVLGLSVDVVEDSQIVVTDNELRFRLLLPYSADWEVVTPRAPEGKPVSLQVATDTYSAIVSTIPNADLAAREHLNEYLDDLVTSRYVDVRFSEILEVSDQVVLCYQSRLDPNKPWVWTFDMLAPTRNGWHHLAFSETPEDDLRPYDSTLVRMIAGGFRSID